MVKLLLTRALILVPSSNGESLLLYIAATTQVVSAALVVEREEEGHTLKVVDFLQESIKGETSFAERRDESDECGEAPCDSLDPLYVLNWAHPCDG